MSMSQPSDFGVTEEILMVKDAAERFFTEKEPLLKLRESVKGSEDPYHGAERRPFFDKALWQDMLELGWHLLAVPEAAGGLDMGLVAAAAIQEEIGRAACPTPLTATLQSTFVLRAAGATSVLAEIAEGKAMALAIYGEEGSLSAESTDVTASGNQLNGTSWYIQDASKADAFIVSARSADGIGLYRVGRDQVVLHNDLIVDLTRDQGRIELHEAEAEEVAAPEQGADILSSAMPALYALLAADIAGAAEWQVQTTADYAKTRVQFERPIGFFQAVKHPIVNMMLKTDETRSLAYNAACAYDYEPEDALRCGHLAQSSASDTASFCSNRSTQLHGGIGFTWEADVQIFHKRQMHSQFLLGDGVWHRQQLAAML